VKLDAALTQWDTSIDAVHTSDPSVDRRPKAQAVVAFTASAGGLGPLTIALRALPVDLAAAIIVAVHTGVRSRLPALLRARCPFPVTLAESGAPIRSGVIYVAPTRRHLIVNADRTFTVADRERVRFARPSADWLFASLAASYGETATAVVLSGYQRDGAQGIIRVRRNEGGVIVQEPATCYASHMPNAAIRTGCATLVLPPDLIATAIVNRVASFDMERLRREFENPFAA
jgi:two-component system, chemotaxis family, protein-glutamate methylesterase/glutaminase